MPLKIGSALVEGASKAERRSSDHSADNATLADIAREGGISKPMIYHCFDSKDGLYLACLHRAGHSIVDAVRSASTE